MRIIFFIILITYSSLSFANSAKEIGKELGMQGNFEGIISQGLTKDMKESLNYTDIEELDETKYNNAEKYTNADIKNLATDKATEDYKANLVKEGFVKWKAYDLKKEDFTDKAKDVMKDPENYVEWLKGEYSDCKTIEGDVLESKSTKTCDEYYGVSENNCKIGQIVEVDSSHKYQCFKERNYTEKLCSKKLKVTCSSDICSSSGIVASDIASDMKFEYNNPYLTIGTIADDYWYFGKGKCTLVERITKFNIKNINELKEAVLVEAGYDDYMYLEINGQLVFNEPHGGDILEVVNNVVIKNSKFLKAAKENESMAQMVGKPCDLGKNNKSTPNKNLRPYLKEGENSIRMRVAVGGHGEAWIKLKINQSCCIEASYWEESCN
jgi:hypothetical protein